MTLPRSFWCHVDYVGPAGDNLTPRGLLTSYPGRAITWLREAARDITPGLDRDSFASVWAWLGDHQGAEQAVYELRCGRPYDFRLQAEKRRWAWTAHLVTVLPVVDSCVVGTRPPRQLAAGVAIRPPPMTTYFKLIHRPDDRSSARSLTMTKEPQRPDIARDLLDRASQAREYRSKLARPGLSRADAVMGRHVDHANAQILRRVMAEHRWPGKSLVGEEAAEAAWKIVLHADHLPDFQRLALRVMITAAEHGEATNHQWAHLQDRSNINAGYSQVYGTQYRYGPAGIESLPIHEPENLDARRASVGLPLFSDAFAELRRRHRTRGSESGQAHDGDAMPELEGAAWTLATAL